MKSTIEWIDIKEKLPEAPINILLTNGKEILSGYAVYYDEKLIFYKFIRGIYSIVECSLQDDWVTHWAFIPTKFE